MGRISGIVLTLSIAALAYGLSYVNPAFDPLVTGAVLGIIISNFIEIQERKLQKGVNYCLKFCLPLGISLYGFQLGFPLDTSEYNLKGLVLVFGALFLVTFVIANLLKLNINTAILLSTGIAVCGASAIAVVSPVIGARKNETSISILAVMTSGLIFTVMYPVFIKPFGLSADAFAFLSGSTLPMLGLVKITASAMGKECLSVALNLKFLRISSLIFMVAFAIVLSGYSKKRFTIPLFMIFFVIFAITANYVTLPSVFLKIATKFSSFFLTITLAAIGLETTLDSVSELGFKPFVVAVLSLSLVTVFLYLFRSVI